MEVSLYTVQKMDCPAEENLIRMKLNPLPEVKHLEFKLEKRELKVYHRGGSSRINGALDNLNLGSSFVSTHQHKGSLPSQQPEQVRVLRTVLLINFSFFLFEFLGGFMAESLGLVADSLDMLADASVYGLSLWAVSAGLAAKKKVALWAGYLQIALAILGFAAVIYRYFLSDTLPDFRSMIIISILALIANVWCLLLLQKSHQKEETHMQASLIFTSNDVIINTGVIVAGVLVFSLNSPLPDLIIGALVFVLVLRGAQRILSLA